MRNYSLNKEDKDKFILNYQIDDNEIIINYADGRSFKTEYSIELEKSILEIMKNQVLNGEKFKKSQVFRKRISVLLWVVLMGGIIFCPIDSLAILLSTKVIVIKGMATLLMSLIVGGNYLTSKINIDDYEKNINFINNMDLIYKGLEENMGVYTDVKEQVKDTIVELVEEIKETETEEIRKPNLNTIDEIDSGVIFDIIDCINKNNEVKGYSKRKTLSKGKK